MAVIDPSGADAVAGAVAFARARPARLGETRVVFIDGPAGSGKTTLGRAVAGRIGCPLVHLDDLYEGWGGLEASWDLLAKTVLDPIARGADGRHPVYDWEARRWEGERDIPAEPWLIVEGCGAARLEAEACASATMWVETDRETRLARGLARDGDEFAPKWRAWQAEEEAHFIRNRTRERSDLAFDGTGRLLASPSPVGWLADPLAAASNLLGAVLTSKGPDGEVAVRITETEAYLGRQDPASHARRGPNPRNTSMFGLAGTAYVYRHLGIHHCVNVVTGAVGSASAVLIRGGEVVTGVEVARERAGAAARPHGDADLASGPGRLARCLGVTLADDGAALLADGRLRLGQGEPVQAEGTGPRIGVSSPGDSPEKHPWRHWAIGEQTVSRPR